MTDFANKVDAIASRWQQVKNTIKSEGTKILRSMQSMIGLMKTIFEVANVSIGNLGEAILIAFDGIVSSLIMAYTAYSALSVTNPLFIISAGVALASLFITLDQARRTATGVNEAKEAASQALSIMSGIRGAVNPWSW